MKELAEYYDQKAKSEVGLALTSIERARRELDQIEENLWLAAAGEPYLRIGSIDGVSAQAVFNAFGSIETAALLRRELAAEAGR